MITETITIPMDAAGFRADRYISEYTEIINRSQMKTRNLVLRLGKKVVKPSLRLKGGEILELQFDELAEIRVVPEKMDLDIIFENDQLAVVNKPMGMVVHPGSGNYTGTLVQGFMYHCQTLKTAFPDESIRPGIVHRLDKDTSGVLILAKNPDALEMLSRQFREKTAKKQYFAIVKGCPERSSGTIDQRIIRDPQERKRFTVTSSETAGKSAVTHYTVQKSWGNYSLLKLSLETGRTHQLRVHLRAIGNPILGDPIYTKKNATFPNCGLMLHSYRLKIQLPSEEKISVFKTPLPPRFIKVLRTLNQNF